MIRVKLTLQQLKLLYLVHLKPPVQEHEPMSDLLTEHCADFQQHFQRLILQRRKRYRVKFSSLQALAFMKLWINKEVPLDPGGYLILELLGEFDHASKKTKPCT